MKNFQIFHSPSSQVCMKSTVSVFLSVHLSYNLSREKYGYFYYQHSLQHKNLCERSDRDVCNAIRHSRGRF